MPLTSWMCDTCGEQISDQARALLTWGTRPDGVEGNFRIVHKSMDGRSCDSDTDYSEELAHLTGPAGEAYLLSMLSVGPLKGGGQPSAVDLDQFVEVFRRLRTPWYEEARPRFKDEDTQHWALDANEYLPYMPESLERIAKGELDDY